MIEHLTPVSAINGTVDIPGDKSISHRSLILGAMAEGCTEIYGLLESADVLSTLSCLQNLGCEISKEANSYRVIGLGQKGFQAPKAPLDCGNSGTTMRLLMGLLAGQKFNSQLIGDASLSRRPMKRISEPLSKMGAKFILNQDNFPPVEIKASNELRAIHYELPIASAQVKSAILLAGLYAEGETILSGKIQGRDHTERMLMAFGASLSCSSDEIRISGGQSLRGQRITVPSDPSTAAFWIAAACLVQDSCIELNNILLNPSRIGFIKVLERMGAKLEISKSEGEYEPVGSIQAKTSHLVGVDIMPDEVASLIDEIPLLAIVASQAHGRTHIQGAEDLRVKESDRILAIVTNLRKLGVEITEHPDGFTIEGPQAIQSGVIDSYDDHRIAMAFSIAALVAKGPVDILGAESVRISYPSFYEDLSKLTSNAP